MIVDSLTIRMRKVLPTTQRHSFMALQAIHTKWIEVRMGSPTRSYRLVMWGRMLPAIGAKKGSAGQYPRKEGRYVFRLNEVVDSTQMFSVASCWGCRSQYSESFINVDVILEIICSLSGWSLVSTFTYICSARLEYMSLNQGPRPSLWPL